jgi:protocatechuate 3,4-dioxygenase alpha subunit
MIRSPSQTIGPFFGMALPWAEGPFVVEQGTTGAIRLAGRLLDGEGQPIGDGLIEIWQAGPDGRFDAPGFRGFGRCPTDREGRYAFLTTKPGRVGGFAPHVLVSVFARGLLKRAVTRIYFPDENEANAADPILSALGARDRATLVSVRAEGGYAFDIRLQGERETVFFEP